MTVGMTISVHLNPSFDSMSSVLSSPLRSQDFSLDALLLTLRSSDVALDEKSGEEESKWGEVEDIEPNGKGLAGGINARNTLVLGVVKNLWDSGTVVSSLEFGKLLVTVGTIDVLGESFFTSSAVQKLHKHGTNAPSSSSGCGSSSDGRDRGGGGRCNLFDREHLDWYGVGDEGVERGVRDSNEELADLHGCQGTLNSLRNVDREGSKGVVCVLLMSEMFQQFWNRRLTIMAWIPELRKTNNQMGGDM